MRASGLIVTVPAAEPAAGPWRDRYDRTARAGVPAHVTVLYPFLPPDEIGGAVLDALRSLFAGRPRFDFALTHAAGFDDTSCLYLAPEPASPFRALTRAVWDRFPQCPPYGGAFTEITPHLTLAAGIDETRLREIAETVSRDLPIAASAEAVTLMESRDGVWRVRETFALAA